MVLINEMIGNFGKYQLFVCFVVFTGKFFVAFHQMAIIFLAPPVSFICPGTNGTCCEKPIYDRTKFSRTIVMEWNLICERSWLKDFNQMLFQFGVLSGSLVFGIASDRCGRRPTLIVSVTIELFTGVVSSVLPDYWSFTIARMFLGFSVGGVMVITFVVVMEYVGSVHRDLISALYQIPFTTGHIILPLFGYFIRDYAYFQLSISLVNTILLVYICVLPESPRWLLAVNKTEDAIKLMQRVAKTNNLPTEEIKNKVDLYQTEHRTRTKGNVFDLFRTPNLRKKIIVMSFIWLVCSYCFYGITQYISHMSGDIYINVAVSGAVCLCGVLISIPLMKCMGRKPLVLLANALCSLCILIDAFLNEGPVSVFFGCIGALFSFMVFVVVYLYCSEMFPTVVRNAALGICSMMARLGAMIAPFVVGLRPYGEWCAPVTFGVFPLIATLLCLLLPETKNSELLMTLEEGESFGKRSSRNTDVIATSN